MTSSIERLSVTCPRIEKFDYWYRVAAAWVFSGLRLIVEGRVGHESTQCIIVPAAGKGHSVFFLFSVGRVEVTKVIMIFG